MATILIVDDYPVTQRLLSHILRKFGYDTLSAMNGLEALELLDAHNVELVISDIAMPQMDGITLLRTLRGDDRYAELPVIMLTASGQDEDRTVAEATGANGFLTKPASSSEIMETVHLYLP